MIELKNIRLEQGKEWTRLVVDIKAESSLKLPENTMWFALPNENADMFNIETYDPFVLLACRSVPFDFITDSCPEYHMRLRIVRFQIKEGVYENIITNLPDDEFPAEHIKHIYNLRWGIETSFRDLKHTIGTANFHSKSPEYIEFEILCRMILYNFCTVITMEVPIKKETGKWVYQVNLSMAIKICFAFLYGRVTLGNVNGLISQYILPVRPDRTYARQLMNNL